MNILMPIDGSDFSNAALAFIASRTTFIGSKLKVNVLNVQLPIPAYPARMVGKAAVRAFYDKEADDVLRPAVARLEKAGLRASAKYVVGSPGRAVAKFASASGADLIVMGSHGHTAFERLLFGSVTNAVLASCTTPLLVVRSSAAPVTDSLKVGIAIDGSRYSVTAVRYVLKHLDLFGEAPVVTLINVVPDLLLTFIPGFADAPAPLYGPERVVSMQTAAFEAAMAPARKLIKPTGLRAAEARLIGNNPGDEIAAYARKKRLDLLVMGSHGYGTLKSAVIGSVATRVAAKCQTALLLIRGSA
jgi:nucleotide-binding universal stress UspA family protein